jgi:predicted peptidase
MDREQLVKSMKPFKEVFPAEKFAERIAKETDSQKKFDNRVGPSVNGSPTIDYHVFSPVKENDTNKYPVLIWLHGMGQGCCFREPVRGTDIANFALQEYQKKFGGGAYIVIPRANEDLGTVDTIHHWLYSHAWVSGSADFGSNSQMPELEGAIRQFLNEEKSNVDLSRVYVAGFSAGGYMTWQTLLAMPNVFAAAAPICHALFLPTNEELNLIKNIPLWVITGEKDHLYPQYIAPTIEKLKQTHNGELRVTILEDVYNPDRSHAVSQHHSWVPVTYDMFYNDGKPYDEKYSQGFIAWLMKNKK